TFTALNEQPTLVTATVQQPPLNSTIEWTSGSKNILTGAQLALIVSTPSESEPTPKSGIATTGTVIGLSGASKSSTGTSMTTLHVQTVAFGSISYVSTSPPQVGSHLSFLALEDLQQFPLSTLPPGSNAFKTSPIPIMAEWENLRDAMNVLLAKYPAQALSILNQRIPSANSQLGASLLFFLSAMNGGGLDKWLGQDFRSSLENAGRHGMLANLDDDFATLARINSDPGGNDWKNLTFPFYDGAILRQIKIFYRQRNKNPQKSDEESTRFVIELDLSKSGPAQLDGLFNKQHFDLVFRSQQVLPDDLKQHVLSIFHDNLEITGIQGKLVFQRTIPFPVHPTEEWENTKHDILDA
ncbi:MAG: hypothetical protein JKX94_06385, partial [Sneathiella sp.]|nr:hypothetical protein [Sneathiella sp.]